MTTSPRSIPQSPAFESGEYTNLFLELGLQQTEVDQKVRETFEQLFYGEEKTERLYFEYGEDLGYIVAYDSKDIRSEGMSYAMMIAVQLNKQELFDKLWRFTYEYMYHKEGVRKGFFSWQLEDKPPFKMLDPNPAPDGEEYFAMALFFAANRWGNGNGICHYEHWANTILEDMLRERKTPEQDSMIHPDEKMVVFSTDPEASFYSDPSYHLPSFYELWSLWSEHDRPSWQEIAAVSRSYFKVACHPKTGLSADYAHFDGSPKETSFNANSHLAAYDAFRVIQNIAMDFHWFQKDPWQKLQCEKQLDFYLNQSQPYPSVFTLEGLPQVETQSPAHVAMNAVGVLASEKPEHLKFVKDLWEQETPKGNWRYYEGLLHLLGLLHVSGNFKIYSPASPLGYL